MTTASNNPYPSVLFSEQAGTAVSAPSSGQQRLFIDSTSHTLKLRNASGGTADVGGGTASVVFHGVKAYATAAQTINNTSAAIALDFEEFDSDAYHDTSTNNTRITIPTGQAGKYLLSGGIGTSGTGFDWIGFKKGGSTNLRGFGGADSGRANYAQCTTIVDLAEADYVEMWAATTANITVGGVGPANHAWFSATKLG